MLKENEQQIRTHNKEMLVCTAVRENGVVYLITRKGGKEDCISLDSFLKDIYTKV